MKVVEGVGEFDPGDPHDAMCESFRIQVVEMMQKAERAAIYRDMDQASQLSVFVAGVLTGLVGVCLVCIAEEGHDEVVKSLADALPFARQQAEDIIQNSLKTASGASEK